MSSSRSSSSRSVRPARESRAHRSGSLCRRVRGHEYRLSTSGRGRSHGDSNRHAARGAHLRADHRCARTANNIAPDAVADAATENADATDADSSTADPDGHGDPATPESSRADPNVDRHSELVDSSWRQHVPVEPCIPNDGLRRAGSTTWGERHRDGERGRHTYVRGQLASAG